jgi:ketopantoate reductase
VGRALARRAAAEGIAVDLVTRDEGWDALDVPSGRPIVVATRNDDLRQVLARTPDHRRSDLVFVQNGMLRSFLHAQGLTEATRGILFFAVPDRQADAQPGGSSPFWGPHAEAVVDWLGQVSLPAHAASAPEFAHVELEKLLWNCIFGLLCEVHELAVGEVVARRSDQVAALAAELAPVAAHVLGITPDVPGMVDRMNAYSCSIPTYRGAVKEWPWRNGWFVEAAAAQCVRLPLHERLLSSRP